ncbi:DNA-binding transcriptional ArsR family regulator [Motilibacter rhizosphaerae]|uniref:DNA-binding transcriptional ArsR family regulator n=1 Tax=Motilibacter rhizosphaerae TaxID=598652 RepID=A0A4Q7NVQ0_9ACTN|nr:winged helix-turn-helix domain-containing protein [Motilibacter rhizosphaerae]RZS91331.1 DNA-binding transcriptional ArsR family regulator [Motilibacter rhizosphaerae]
MTVRAEALAGFASLLADRSRAEMCLALLDGRAWTAGELARQAGIAASTASGHLSLLVSAGLLAEERQGRHRYVRLADAETADLIEDLAAAVGAPERPTSLRTVRAGKELAAARTCYDHLAGALGVQLLDALVDRSLVARSDGLALTPAGRTWFLDVLGPVALEVGTRPLLRTCLDWTERRHHLGGALAAGLLQELVRREWVSRAAGHRAVAVTPAGAAGLQSLLGVRAGGSPGR